MKKLIQGTFLVFMLLSVMPITLKAEKAKTEKKVMTEVETTKANVLITRLKEIEAMDKSALTRTERRVLRKEVKSINSNLANLNGGVYLTTGAIIIIILLLILIL